MCIYIYIYYKLKDRITPQVNFFRKWASMVLAGTGKKGKTKEVVKDREGKTVGMYVCMHVCMYVCMYVWGYVCMRVRMYVCSCMCVTKVRVKDAACQRWSWPSAPPSAICTKPATQNDRGCAIVPRLPREIKVDVTKCHACHAEVARRHGRHGRLNQDLYVKFVCVKLL